METEILTPVLALVAWSLVVCVWLFCRRIPAMTRAKIDPATVAHPAALPGLLPKDVEAVADNYNHLMEQPTVFYALCFYLSLSGAADPLAVQLAWVYVGLRIVHSLIQNLGNPLLPRFAVFLLSTAALIVMTVRALLSLAH